MGKKKKKKKKKQRYPFSKEGVIEFFRREVKHSIRKREIYKIFSRKIEPILDELIEEGILVRVKKNSLGLCERVGAVRGRFDAKAGGYGFVIPDDGSKDIFIPPGATGTAFNGDRVLAVKIRKRRNRIEGRIIKILKRERTEFVGRIVKEEGLTWIEPIDRTIPVYFFCPHPGKVKEGDVVLFRLVEWTSPRVNPVGEIIEKISPEKMGIEIIIKDKGLREKYSEDCMKELETLSEDIEEEIKRRVDLTRERIITIDPEDAKDFDDAISIEKIRRGYRVGVHISDVSYWVRRGGAIDKEAGERGTSVYLPDRTLHMLPPELTRLTSLLEGEKRLTISVIMEVDKNGHVRDYDIVESVVVNRKRMNYKEAQDILDEKRDSPFKEDLKIAWELASTLRERRRERGSLDFDIPEMKVILDENGEVLEVREDVRYNSHRLIEELMILANEVVAEHLYMLKVPSIYRVHEEPDELKLKEFFRFVSLFGHRVRSYSRKGLQEVIERVRGKDYEHIVNYMLLRSMKRARYVATHAEHYGLASKFYTHFTSPIRRYPDLIIQRLLKGEKYSEKELEYIADRATECEWKADEAERESVKVKILEYLNKHRNREYPGIVTNVTFGGIWVELKDFFIDGFLPRENLPQDLYKFREKDFMLRGKRWSFRLGDTLLVRIEDCDPIARELTLEFAGKLRRK